MSFSTPKMRGQVTTPGNVMQNAKVDTNFFSNSGLIDYGAGFTSSMIEPEIPPSIVGLFVALTQIDFTIVRLGSDLIVNYLTTTYFLRGKIVDRHKYDAWLREQNVSVQDDESIDVSVRPDQTENGILLKHVTTST